MRDDDSWEGREREREREFEEIVVFAENEINKPQ